MLLLRPLLLGAVRERGLIDAPIAGTSLQYLTSSAGQTWTAAADGLPPPAGCHYSTAPGASTRTVTVLASGQLEGVRSPEACCVACWAEALCTAALHDGSSCLLETLPSYGVATVEAASLAGGLRTRCTRRRDGAPRTLQIPALVPGDLLTDLQAARQIGDPLYEKNFLNASLWSAHTWTYRVAFTPDAAVAAVATAVGGRVLLVFDGVKMGAGISLDGVALGTAADQFLRYTFDVTALLTPGNTRTKPKPKPRPNPGPETQPQPGPSPSTNPGPGPSPRPSPHPDPSLSQAQRTRSPSSLTRPRPLTAVSWRAQAVSLCTAARPRS